MRTVSLGVHGAPALVLGVIGVLIAAGAIAGACALPSYSVGSGSSSGAGGAGGKAYKGFFKF